MFKSEHTELALIGFVFLFLLSMLILNSDIQYKIGVSSTTTYNFLNNETDKNPINSTTVSSDVYSTFTADENLSWLGRSLANLIGYWLAVASAVGFIGVLMGWRKGAKY